MLVVYDAQIIVFINKNAIEYLTRDAFPL